MHKYFYAILFFGFPAILAAQTPHAIPYQAVARNSAGVPLSNQIIKVRFSIRDSLLSGTIVYRETHTSTTNALGLFNLNVGLGTPITGIFSGINWGKNFKFLQVEMDPAGENSYVDLGTQQMMSVPFALHSATAAKIEKETFKMISNLAPSNQGFYNFRNSLEYCVNLSEGGFSDWRLPTLDEWFTYCELNGVPQIFSWTKTTGVYTGGSSTQTSFYLIFGNSPEIYQPNYGLPQIQCVR
jgi:hypothetical protein